MSLHIAAPTDIIGGVEKEGNCTSRLSLLTITGIAAPLLISVIVEAEETKQSTLPWSGMVPCYQHQTHYTHP